VSEQNFDVIIVGAGIAGASLACKLAKDNAELNIALIEARPFTYQFDDKKFEDRVVALTAASQDFLEELNVWFKIECLRVCPFTKMSVWDGTGTGHIEFDSQEVNQHRLGHIVENNIIVSSLNEQITQFANINMVCPAKVSALDTHSDEQQNVVILEDGSTLHAPLVVAADGANSPLRHMANLDTVEWEYGHTAIVCTVETEQSHQHVARQCFTELGPLAFLPLEDIYGNTQACSIVWSVLEEQASEILALDDDAFCDTLSHYFENTLGVCLKASKRISFPLRQRHSKKYFQSGVVLVGDAAHTIHPLAGQGINLGIQDVTVLAEEIHRAMQRGIPLYDESILQRYQRRRKGANLAMMAVMEGFKQLFGQNSIALRWLRNEGMSQINRHPLLKNKIIREAMGL